MRRRYRYTITKDMVRSPRNHLPKSLFFFQSFGRPQLVDVGKRVYEVTSDSGYHYLQMENEEQSAARDLGRKK